MIDPVEPAVPLRGLFHFTRSDEVDGSIDWHGRVRRAMVAAVGVIAGPEAARTVEADGLEMLHLVITANDVTRLREQVLESMRGDLLRLAARVGRRVLGWRDEFYIDDYLILRVNFPYDVARQANAAAENPGIGRVSPHMRSTAAARRVIDPVFDPKGYHRSHPPAAWAHGPHRDSWTGHSTDGVNIWWAISRVPAEAGMVMYPDIGGTELASDPRSGYLRAGYVLPRPTYTPMDAGQMLVFDPEVLHGTHLNITDTTRVAVSMRINANQPQFDPACFYAREFWHRATAVEAGAFDQVLHLKREEHLAPAASAPRLSAPPSRSAVVALSAGCDGWTPIGLAAAVRDGTRLVVEHGASRMVVSRSGNALRAFESACPHYGVDLSDGAIDDASVYCPGCGVGFDLATGQSGSKWLTLQPVGVQESNGHILLDLRRKPADGDGA